MPANRSPILPEILRINALRGIGVYNTGVHKTTFSVLGVTKQRQHQLVSAEPLADQRIDIRNLIPCNCFKKWCSIRAVH